jgi:hypothetical protein
MALTKPAERHDVVTEQQQLEATIAHAIAPLSRAVAKMSGSVDEHKDHVHRSLARIEKTQKDQGRELGGISAMVRRHETEISSIQNGKDEKKPFKFSGTHLTLILLGVLGLVAMAGTALGVDILGFFK